ncbi:MAG TPA: biopolymer transporter ExbD [Pseudomonadota bacterium]|jgi:biopolymer transport protein ExbD|nr:biopolymer transporter ExbD [Pseudomonadota bacterium]HNN53528.1 biopolymer transporter ExbD [Pseudomonadota bacterium]
MGGAAVVSSGKGGRKSLDAAINLVPFIDLLSCCISFLLITAVWVNLGRIEVKPPASRNDGTDQEIDTDAKVTLTLSSSGVVISRSTGEETQLPRIAGQIDEAGLGRQLALLRSALPKQHNMTLRAYDSVQYADLVKTMDLARGASFSSIEVTPTNQ